MLLVITTEIPKTHYINPQHERLTFTEDWRHKTFNNEWVHHAQYNVAYS